MTGVARTMQGTINQILGIYDRLKQGEFNAIDTALARLSEGDLCLILIDQVEAALAYIQGKVTESQAALAK